MHDNYSESSFKITIAFLLARIWLLDNDIKMNPKNEKGFTALVQDFIYKMDKQAMARQTSYNFEKRQRHNNKAFVKMKFYLDKFGWDKFMEGITMYY